MSGMLLGAEVDWKVSMCWVRRDRSSWGGSGRGRERRRGGRGGGWARRGRGGGRAW